MKTSAVCWVLTPGAAGMRSQALGLAEAVGMPILEKRVFMRPALAWLPAGLLPLPLAALDPSGDPLAPPWPELVIACGRRAIDAALAVKRLSEGRTIAAYVQNPELGRGKFDLVAAMQHDKITGRNVVTVRTALHRITPERLKKAADEWRERIVRRGGPLLGVLLGGDTSAYRLTAAALVTLIATLKGAHEKHGFRAIVAPSRRTGQAAKRMLADALGSENWAEIWDESGENPYFGILALSDRMIVTGDSISMISEALATGRPVHVLRLEGKGRRHDAFLASIIEDRLVSPIDHDDLDWSFEGQGPIDATGEPAARLRALLDRRMQG